eukprot:540024-Prymnesium_polylepis.1
MTSLRAPRAGPRPAPSEDPRAPHPTLTTPALASQLPLLPLPLSRIEDQLHELFPKRLDRRDRPNDGVATSRTLTVCRGREGVGPHTITPVHLVLVARERGKRQRKRAVRGVPCHLVVEGTRVVRDPA